jgi:predicted dehydrogenase
VIRVALFGHGFLGKWHAQKAQAIDGVHLAVIVEPNQGLHNELQRLYPEAQIASSFHGVKDQFDAALIVTPTSYHFDLCRELIELGKHIFCEKPITTTAEEARELASLLTPGQVFQSGHSERCHPLWNEQKVVQWLEATDLSVTSFRQSPFKGRATDVDVLSDLMIHDIDLMLWLFKETPVSVSTKGYKIRTELWDYAEAHYKFSSGKSASLYVGRNSAVEERRWLVNSASGQMALDLAQESVTIASKQSDEAEVLAVGKGDHLLIEQQAFYKSIGKGAPILVDISAGVLAIEVLEGTLHSLKHGKEFSFFL